jgi:phenylpropionate dioxygenase-like ring-hydroxylating dioxygenase large terminal subunit
MFIQNCWYVAAWQNEIPAGGILARTIANQALALWRDRENKVIAFLDRCCHRGAPLSLGACVGNGLRCNYHGLVFNSAGACVSAPAQDRIPQRARVRTFPVVEQYQWVWVWMGNPADADVSLIPQTPWLDHVEWRYKPGYLHYDTNYLLISDNLLDFSHLPYLHPTSLGGSPDYAAVVPTMEKIDRGVRLTKWVFNTDPPAYSAQFANYAPGTKVDRWAIYDFLVPGVLILDAGMAPTGTGAKDGRRDNALEFRSCQALAPERDNSSHYFFAQAHNFLLDRPDVTEGIYQGLLTAFEEDRVMITAQAQNLAHDPNFKMVPFSVDSALGQFRWVVSKLIKQEQEKAVDKLESVEA